LAAANGDAALAARAAAVQVNTGGSHSVNLGGPLAGPVQTRGVTRINTWDNANGESGILATARRDGTPRSADELRPTDRVTIKGIETNVGNAIRLGLLAKDASTGIIENASPEQLKEATGEAEAVRAAEAAAKAQVDAQAAAEAAKLAHPEAEQAAQTLASKVTEGTQVRALMELAETGEVSERAIQRASSEAGVYPHEMAATISKALDGFTQQAQEFLAARGVDPRAFYQWAKVDHPSDFKAAMIGHVTHRNTAAWATLADRYMTNLDHIDPQVILSATLQDGIKANFDPGTRNVILDIPGHGQMSWGAAIRAGLIGPHRRG
jgi:hypothetical protein